MPSRTNKTTYISFADKRKKEIASASQKAATVAGHKLRTAWLKKLTGPRTGETYRVPGTKKTYVASAPGQAPASRLGDFRRSIGFEVVKDSAGASYYFGTPLDYPYYLEFGFDHISGSRVAARPSLLPAYEENKESVKALIKQTFSEAMQGKATLEFEGDLGE